ncbi:MAG: ABC transporter ATP-binding protein [Alphaproteobacteria bacterium CG_4_10_14_0_8_um_filter_37_21]|nr:MAG: ABC transporter ATP-binding protein [Alphaproteobacteria bacterium CG_4_10_14_0_8_um_filter_37_21]
MISNKENTSMLNIENLTVEFGSIKALNSFSRTWSSRVKKTGIIGPNGSGKSTLFKVLSGFIKPSSGKIVFKGQDLTHQKSHEINHFGIARTFQIPCPFTELTVFENVYTAALQHVSKKKAKDISEEYLKRFLLDEKAHINPSELSLVDKRLLEIARALATQPKLLLLDEVLAGLRPQEVENVLRVIEELQRENNFHIIMIEHNIHAIKRFCEELVVLSSGKMIASGPVETCLNNKVVQKIYTGNTE